MSPCDKNVLGVDHLASITSNATSDPCCSAMRGGNDSPFSRSSKTKRTPPSVSVKETEGNNSGVVRGKQVSGKPTKEEPAPKRINGASSTGKEKTYDKAAVSREKQLGEGLKEALGQSLDTLRLQIASLREREEALISACLEEITTMELAVKKQPNVNTVVKRGLPKLCDFLKEIQTKRRTWKNMEEVLCRETQTRGRLMSSPPAMQRQTSKRSRETSASPQEANNPRPIEKKKREEEAWQEVKKRKEKKAKTSKIPAESADVAAKKKEVKRSAPKARRSAISIKPGANKSYSEVLKDIKDRIDPDKIGAEIRAIRQTRDGQVLMELGRTADAEKLSAALVTALGTSGTVRSLVPKISVEIRDLDCLTEKEDVEKALKRDFQETGELKVVITKTNAREQRMAIVEMGEKVAASLLKQGRIKIGWVSCRVRRRTTVQRCFRCLGYGHVSRACRGPDRSHLCFSCGEADHKAKDCKSPKHCVLCAEKGLDQLAHAPGSGNCAVFREALEKARGLG